MSFCQSAHTQVKARHAECLLVPGCGIGHKHILADGTWAKIKTLGAFPKYGSVILDTSHHVGGCSSPFFLIILVLITKHSISKHYGTNPGYKGHITHM